MRIFFGMSGDPDCAVRCSFWWRRRSMALRQSAGYARPSPNPHQPSLAGATGSCPVPLGSGHDPFARRGAPLVALDGVGDPLGDRADTGVDAELQPARAAVAEADDPDQLIGARNPRHDRAAAVALTGILAALAQTGAEHVLAHAPIIALRLVAFRIAGDRNVDSEKVVGTRGAFRGGTPSRYSDVRPHRQTAARYDDLDRLDELRRKS